MEPKAQLRVLNNRPSSPGISRRQAAQWLASGAAAGLAPPALAATHPIHKHLADPAALAEAQARAAAATAAWKPEFFSPHQSETFSVLAERMIPGSGRAQVNRFVDLLLSVDTRETQQRFVNSLAAFDAESLRRHERPFKQISEAQQKELLSFASTQQSGRGQRRREPEPERSEPPAYNLRDHFENLKAWTRGAYYSSEVGMRELGWTGEVDFPSFPGCEHPDGHQ